MKIKSVKSINPCISVIQMIYDIITKGHGGELDLISNAGEGAKFKIELPDK